MKSIFSLVFGVAFLVAGCTSTVTTYSLNAAAQKNPIVEIKYTNSGLGRGPMTATTKNGETFKGEFTTIEGGSYGFGRIYSQAYGTAWNNHGGYANGVATGQASSFSFTGANSNPGIATLQGSRGTVLDCEYMVSEWTGSGVGACRSTKGGLYRVHF